MEFYVYKLYKDRMNRIKVRFEVNVEPEASYPFDLTENIGPWEVPFVCILIKETFFIYSLLTGQRVFSLSISKEVANGIGRQIDFSGLQCWQDRIIFWSNVKNYMKIKYLEL